MTALGQPPRLSHAIRVELRRAFHKPFEIPFRGKVVRWLILTMAPWMLIPGLVSLTSLPTVGLWTATYPSWRGQRIPESFLIADVAMGCATAVLSWIFGARPDARFAQRRRDKLASFLADPGRG